MELVSPVGSVFTYLQRVLRSLVRTYLTPPVVVRAQGVFVNRYKAEGAGNIDVRVMREERYHTYPISDTVTLEVRTRLNDERTLVFLDPRTFSLPCVESTYAQRMRVQEAAILLARCLHEVCATPVTVYDERGEYVCAY